MDRNIKIGADPEVFIKDKDNKIVPAFLLVNGTKDYPTPISEEGHAIQSDNVMLEYNIPPCSTKEEFIKANNFVLNYCRETICEPNGYTLSIEASSHVGEEYLVNPQATEMGCLADYNAYTKEQNVIERNSQTLRSAGKIECQTIQ